MQIKKYFISCVLLVFVFGFLPAHQITTSSQGVSGGGSPVTQFEDNFNEDASQTELKSHDPDIGDASSWSVSLDNVFYVDHADGQDDAVSLSDSTSIQRNALNSTSVSGNVTITCEVGFNGNPATSNYRVGFWARASQSSWSMTGYSFRIQGDTGNMSVAEWTGGSANNLFNDTITNYDYTHRYRIIGTLNGSTISAIVQDMDDSDAQVFSDSTTDANHSSGDVGLYMRNASSAEISNVQYLKVVSIP